MKTLHLGCGNKKLKGSIGLDIVNLPSVDVVYDLNLIPWPFKENNFDEVFAPHVIEHLSSTVKTMEEIWRVSKDGAQVIIRVPHFSSPNAYVDPTHLRFFAIDTMNYFTENSELNFYSKARFKINKINIHIKFPKIKFIGRVLTWIFNRRKLNHVYEFLLCRVIPIAEVEYKLEVKK